MPHTSKKRSSVGNNSFDPPARRSRKTAGQPTANFDQLDYDILANILGFLRLKSIMGYRRVSKKWREAIKKAVPLCDFYVRNVNNYNAMTVMATALPNLQKITLSNLGFGDNKKYIDGEDPDEEQAAYTTNFTTHDIEIMSNFNKLQILTIKQCASLNGRYPFLFNSFPQLQKLIIESCKYLKVDLETLAGLPLLKELECRHNPCFGNIRSLRMLKDTIKKVKIRYCGPIEGNLMDLADLPHLKELDLRDTTVKGDLGDIGENDFSALVHLTLSSHSSLTGNVRNLRVLKDTLETLTIASCANVEGNLMDLADFPYLKELNLYNTAVAGDVRDIGENDFINLEKLRLPFGVVGGREYKFEHIADAASVANAYYRLKRRANFIWEDDYRYYEWFLSDQSPDYYAAEELEPPHCFSFVEVGTRLGWRWTSNQRRGHSCEINWLDPEPDREKDDYEDYVEDLGYILEEINYYKGYHQPPTEEEYRRLCREYTSHIDFDSDSWAFVTETP